MRTFDNMAKLIRIKRLNHPDQYSQSELSTILGYKNGQFISNVERALCNIHLKMLSKVSVVLNIEPQDIKDAILKDTGKTLDNYLAYKGKEKGEENNNTLPFAVKDNVNNDRTSHATSNSNDGNNIYPLKNVG